MTDSPGKFLYFDIETHSADEIWDMAPDDFFRLGQYAWDDGPVVLTESRTELIEQIEKAPYIVGHNIFGFDLTALYGKDSMRPLELAQQRRVIDTMVLAHLLTPSPYSYTNRQGHTFYDASKPESAMRYYGLDNLCFQFGLEGKLGNLQELAKKYNPPKTLVRDLDYGLIPVDDPEFREYAIQDVVADRDLYKHLMFVQSRVNYDGDYLWRELELAGVMSQISRNGIRVDAEAARARVQRQHERQEEIMADLVDRFEFPTKGKAPWKSNEGKEAIIRALDSYGIRFGEHPDWAATEKGAPSFAGDTLREITRGTEAEELGEALAELQGQRSMAQLALESMHSDGRVHPNITAFQRSGRWSFTSPGITIWDRDNKDVFLADDNHYCVEFDFSNADARAVAALSGDDEYAIRFEVNEDGTPKHDGHNLTGESSFGADEYYSLTDKNGKPLLRPVAKIIGLGTNYNMGAKKLCATLNETCRVFGIDREFSREETKEILYRFNGTFWKLKAWKDKVAAQGDTGSVTNEWNRRMVVDEGRSWTMSPALMGQSTTREMMGDALLRICRLGGDWPRRLRGIIHDALVVDLPQDTAERDAETVQGCMEQTFHPKGGMPIHFPAGVGPLDATDWKSGAH